jgi:membrane protein DedA with SNARE-associated domain
MEKNNKIPTFTFGVVAIILGWTLVKHFDFKNLKFQQPWLDALYIIIFIFSIYALIKNYKRKTEK